MRDGVLFNAYPDSIGGSLSAMAEFLKSKELSGAVSGFYILPTVFNTDIDGGFSVISYDLCRTKARPEDLAALREAGIGLAFDLILNHLSVLSPQFRDILKNGDASPYRDFFIDWNRFWEGRGEIQSDGCVHPGPGDFIQKNLRKPGLPVLMARLPDGTNVPYWNTFYQNIKYPAPDPWDLLDACQNSWAAACGLSERIKEQLGRGVPPDAMDWSGFEDLAPACVDYLNSRREYLGQMDVNIKNPLVWQWYEQTMARLAGYGARLIRLDAFTRLHKAPGRLNFLNEPETWELLSRLKTMAAEHGLEVLPEMHAPYHSKAYSKIAAQGCATYDYFLPGLILDAIDTGDASYLRAWADELIDHNIHTVNMLGCHDGIPVKDLRGLLPDDRIEAMVSRVCARGGRRKMIHGDVPEVYQLDCAYLTALGSDPEKLLLARAIQIFMPGRPQVWYNDLLLGENDESVFASDPAADTREINRRPFTSGEARARLDLPAVREQIKLMRLRNTHPAFGEGSAVTVGSPEPGRLTVTRRNRQASLRFQADLKNLQWEISEE